MGNYITNDKTITPLELWRIKKDFEIEINTLKNQLDQEQKKCKELLIQNENLKKRYQSAIEDSVSFFEEIVALKKIIALREKKSNIPCGHTNFSWNQSDVTSSPEPPPASTFSS